MNKEEQIAKMVEASLLIAQVMHFCDDEFGYSLYEIRNKITDVIEQIGRVNDDV